MSTTGTKSVGDSSSATASQADTLVNQEDTSTTNFTATGRPMPTDKPSGLSSMPGGGGFTSQAPQFLPVKFNDDSVIPVPVLVAKNEVQAEEKRRSGFMGILKGIVSGPSGKGEDGATLKVVYMPRRDYLRYFAKDDQGNYAGTEPQKSWTGEELDKAFAQYAPKPK